jgi:hypothetical protein
VLECRALTDDSALTGTDSALAENKQCFGCLEQVPPTLVSLGLPLIGSAHDERLVAMAIRRTTLWGRTQALLRSQTCKFSGLLSISIVLRYIDCNILRVGQS